MSYQNDSVFQGVTALCEPANLAPLLRQVRPWSSRGGNPPPHARCLYLNYKPFERARVVLSVHGTEAPGGAVTLVLVVGGPPPKPTHSSSGVAIPEWQARAWPIEEAPGLRPLVHLVDEARLRARVGDALDLGPGPLTISLVRYVPRRRAVLTIGWPGCPKRIYVKLARAKDAGALVAGFASLESLARREPLAFRVPKVLLHDEELGTVFLSEVPGRSFTDTIHDSDGRAFAALGTALASLHRAELRPAATWTSENQLDDLRRHIAGMGQALPDLRARLDALVSQLAAREPGSPRAGGCPIHGNLFGEQILWDGSRIGLVDWDRLALGDPYYDVGRLLAHHVYSSALSNTRPEAARQCADALVNSYASTSLRAIDGRRLAWHLAVELLLRAKISALRPLADGWPNHCARAVEESERLLEGACRYVNLPGLFESVESAL